ncbi:hypothetical protein J1N35_029585 [Gossypium stocksii]|uniref:Uncharacterized protein n=1 Tax=Gossypium stocksii TaxID=47602 RepID=A0A9D3ZT76_9ROSI|nr:hypothetical protein J1N35_029585 [Gossypium stocksii]
MKERIGTTIARCCGRKMSRLFYIFSISFNLLKFQQMKLVGKEDLGVMVGIYCSNGDDNTEPIQLFAKLVDPKLVKNVTLSSQQYEFDFDLNVR